MKLKELKSILRAHPDTVPCFILPSGEQIAAHFHVTEVGPVSKVLSIAAGPSVTGRCASCKLMSLRIWTIVSEAERFADVLDLGRPILPNDDLEVESV